MSTSKTMRKLVGSISLTLVALAAATSSWSLPPDAGASSHREAPRISKDPSVDNTDVFAFRSPDDPDKITLISNWIPFEEPAGGPNFYHFDDNARYLIKVDRDGDAVEDVTYEWTFNMQIRNRGTFLYNTGPITSLDDEDFNYRQFYTVREIVRGGETTVLGQRLLQPPDNIGPRSTPNYERLAEEAVYEAQDGIKIFTGQRDDPFYIDIGSIFDLLGLRPFNRLHRIRLDNTVGIDSLGGFNIHTTAIQVPRDRVAPRCHDVEDGDHREHGHDADDHDGVGDRQCVIGVWSTAERRSTVVRRPGEVNTSGSFLQVSRLGNPLVNELVVDLARKDLFNSTPPTGDAAVLDRVLDLELAGLIENLYPGIKTPSGPRNDLVAIFLTGISGLNQQAKSTDTPSEQLRLNIAIEPTADTCRGNPLGVLDGDLAGFPNGRRLEDDVTDIELRAAAGATPLTPRFNRAPNNRLGDGVNENDRPCLSGFPYLATPHQGYEHAHHPEGDDSTREQDGRNHEHDDDGNENDDHEDRNHDDPHGDNHR